MCGEKQLLKEMTLDLQECRSLLTAEQNRTLSLCKANEELQEEVQDEVLDNLREAIKRAQRLGDTSTADLARTQLAQKLRRSAASRSKITIYMRTLTVQRRRTEREKTQDKFHAQVEKRERA